MPDSILDKLTSEAPQSPKSSAKYSILDKLGEKTPNIYDIQGDIEELPKFLNNDPRYTLDPELYNTKFQTEFTDMINSFKQGWDQTQLTNKFGKMDEEQKVIDENVDRKKDLLNKYQTNSITYTEYKTALFALEQADADAENNIKSYLEDIHTNEKEIENEYVSKIYKIKESLIQAKGGDSGLWESLIYTFPSIVGSSAALAGQQLAATFGTQLMKRIATAAATSWIGGPIGEIIGIGAAIVGSLGMIANSRIQESYSEVGGAIKDNQEKLINDFIDKNGIAPNEEQLRKIRMQARKGSDDMFWQQMTLAVPDAIQALLMPGSKLLKVAGMAGKSGAVKSFLNYNKYTRAGKDIGKLYANYITEKAEEGFQYVTQQRMEDEVFDLGKFTNQDFMANTLTDYWDTMGSISYGPWGTLRPEGKFAEDKAFQFAEGSGGLLGALMGGVSSGISISKDVKTFYDTHKELRKDGILNADDKIFRLQDQTYLKYFDQDKVEFLLEGMRGLSSFKTDKGEEFLSKEDIKTETDNIKKAFDKYKIVHDTVESIVRKDKLGFAFSKKQKAQIAAYKEDVFHYALQSERHKAKIAELRTKKLGVSNETSLFWQLSDTKNEIEHLKTFIETGTKILEENPALSKTDVLGLKERIKLAKQELKLKETLVYKPLVESAKQSNIDLNELGVTLENSDVNKRLIIESLYKQEMDQKYLELSKIQYAEGIESWYNQEKEKKEAFKNKTYTIANEVAKKDAERKTQLLEYIAQQIKSGTNPEEFNQEEADLYSSFKKEIDEYVQGKPAVIPSTPAPVTSPVAAKTVIYNNEEWEIKAKFKNKEGKEFIKLTSVKDKKKSVNISIDEFNKLQVPVELTPDTSEPPIDQSQSNTKFETAKATTVNKTESGRDNDKTPSADRWFRYLEANKVADKKLLVVTKKNNLELYKQIVALRAKEPAGEWEKKNPEYNKGIYVVLVDANNNHILSDGKLLFATLTTPERLDKNELAITDLKTAKEELIKFREALLAKEKSVYLTITGKSKGIIQYLPAINGQRQSKSVTSSLVDKIEDAELEIATAKHSAEEHAAKGLGYIGSQLVQLGKLYIKDKSGKWLDLVPRFINEQEIDFIIRAMEQRFGLTNKFTDHPIVEINKLIFFGTPKSGAKTYTTDINKEGLLVLGTTTLTKEEFSTEAGKAKVKEHLKNIRVNVNIHYDFKNETFIDPFGKKWDTYQEFLLSGENPMFGSDVAPKGQVQFRNQYLTFEPNYKKEVFVEKEQSALEVTIFKNQENIVRKEDSYVINGVKYERVSYAIDNTFTGDPNKFDDSRIAGHTVDKIVRNYFQGNTTKPEGISLEAFNSIIKRLDEINTHFQKTGEKILAQGIVLFDPVSKIAGEVDLLSIDKEGKIRIYDIKSSKTSVQTSDYTKKWKGKGLVRSKKDQHSIQQSAYKNLFEKQYGIKVETIAIIPFKIAYIAKTGAINTAEADGKTIILEYNKEVEKYVSPAVAEKKEVVAKVIPTSKSDPFAGLPTFNSEEELNAAINKAEKTQKAKKTDKSKTKKVYKKKTDSKGDKPQLDRLASRSVNKQPITQAEIEWFKQQFPRIPIVMIKGLIENKSLGRFISAGRVLLSTEATVGTLRHEAFHTVTQLFLTQEEITKLYLEAKRGRKMTDLEIEEELAEDYTNYVKTGKILGNRPVRNTIFRRILNFIKDLLNLKASSIEDVYRRLDNGFYSNKDIVGVRQFTRLDKALPGLSEGRTKELLDGMDAIFFDIIFKGGKTPAEALAHRQKALEYVYDDFIERYNSTSAEDEGSIELYEYAIDNWDLVQIQWLTRLNAQGFELELDLETDDNISEEGNPEEVADGRQGDALTDSNQISNTSTLSDTTRFLIRSLKQKELVNNELVDKLSPSGLPQTVSFSNTFNLLLKHTAGLYTFPEVLNKIKELSALYPEFVELAERLGEPSSGNLSNGMMQQQFRQDMAKNRYNSQITLLQLDGNVYIIDATKQVTSDRVKEKWEYWVKESQNTEGETIVPEAILKINDNLEFLKALGIVFSEATLEYEKESKTIQIAAQNIRKYITENKRNVTLLFDKTSTVKGSISALADLEATYDSTVNELSYISSEGKTIYSISLNNALAIIKNIINNVQSEYDEEGNLIISAKDLLFQKLPHLNTEANRNSVWLNTMFDSKGHKRKDVNIELGLHDGLRGDVDTSKISKSTKKITIGDKYVQEINSILLHGRSSYLRASDKSQEHTLHLTNYGNKKKKLAVDIASLDKGFDMARVREIFTGYFHDEVSRIALFKVRNLGQNIDKYNQNGSKFTTFSFLSAKLKAAIQAEIDALIDKDLTEPQLIEAIAAIVNNHKAEAVTEVVRPSTGEKDLGGFLVKCSNELRNKLNQYGISKDIGMSKEFKETPLDQLLRAVTVNDFINSVEQTKLFIGDMAFYSDLFKRTAGFTGTKETAEIDDSFNNWLNDNFPRKDKKKANGKIDALVFEDSKQKSNYFNSYTEALINIYKDEKTKELGRELTETELKALKKQTEDLLEPYLNMLEGDAQGWITMDEYREFALRRGQWDNVKEVAWQKAQSGQILSSQEISHLLVLKAQYAGPQEYAGLFVPTYHKFSLMPLIPQLIKDKNLQELNAQMEQEQVGYALFKSGSKVGTKLNDKGEATRFYTGKNQGTINTKNWIKETVYYQFLGLQQVSAKPKDKVIFGTQFRKLVFGNAFIEGQEAFKGARALEQEYSKIIDELVQKEKIKLIKSLGLDLDNLTVKDVTKLVELLQKEARKRSLPDNIIDSLQTEIIEDKIALKYNIDAMVNVNKVNSMIMSLVNSRLIRQKMNGDSMVQGSVAGFESIGKRAIGSNDSLEFYEKDENGNTKPAQCKLAMSGQYKVLLREWGGLKELNEAIKEKKIPAKILQLVGYRIPTQGHNSMEFLTITEFLPEDSPTLIVLPTEIVAKSGGDFDIDKLNIFRPVLELNTDTYTNIVSIINEDLERFNEVINDNSPESNIIKSIFAENITEERQELETLKEFRLTKEDLQELQKLGGTVEKIKAYYKDKSKQNRIIEIAAEVLSNPHSFKFLISPNSNHLLTEVVDEFRFIDFSNKKAEKGEALKFDNIEQEQEYRKNYKKVYEKSLENIQYADQLKLTIKIEQFYKFLLAKEMIGIVAIHNTHHAICQQVNASVNKFYSHKGLEKEANVYFDRYHLLEEDKISLAKQKDAKEENYISEIISQLINATVDAVKNPFLFELNLTLQSLPTFIYLIRIGVPIKDVAYFMKQPVITKYLQEISRNNSVFIKVKGLNKSKEQIQENIQKEYLKDFNLKSNKEIKKFIKDLGTSYNSEYLSQFLIKDTQLSKKEEFDKTQLQVLRDFIGYEEQASRLTDAMKAVNHDTAGVGSSIHSSIRKLEQIEEAKQDGFFNGIDEILNNTLVKTFNQHKFTIDAFGQFYYTYTPEIEEYLNKLANTVAQAKEDTKKFLDDKSRTQVRTLINNEFISFIVQNFGYTNLKELQNKVFNVESVAKRILRIQKDPKTPEDKELAENLLVKELYPIINKAAIGVDNIKVFAKRYDSFTSNQLTEAFRELKEKDPKLAQDLMDLGILQSGLNNSPITYLGIIPQEYYNELVKQAFEKFKSLDNQQEILSKFPQLFVRNNALNNNIKELAEATKLGTWVKKVVKFEAGNAFEVVIKADNGLGHGIYSKDYNLAKYNNKLNQVFKLKEQVRNIPINKEGLEEDDYTPDNTETTDENEGPQFQKETVAEQKINDDRLIEIANKLSNKFEIPYSIETPEVALEYLKSEGVTEFQTLGDLPIAFYHKGVVIFVSGKATLDTPFHEFSHPFIDLIEKNNKALFLNLKLQLNKTKEGKEIIEFVKRNYSNLVKNGELTNTGYKEAVVTALGKLAANQLTESKGLIDALKQLLKRISEYLQQLLSDKNKSVKPLEIKANTTLEELAVMLNLENKIDLRSNEVNYSTKAVNIIINNLTKVSQWWSNKSIDKPTFWKKVQELGIPKEQLELLKESEGDTIENKLINFASNYSYTVEINTAKGATQSKLQYFPDENQYEEVTELVPYDRAILQPDGRYKVILVDHVGEEFYPGMFSKEDAIKEFGEYLFKPKESLPNSQYYSNLTVPGGTNYTENEISTPLITPSIKGHAQFSTDNGIGWFRSDDRFVSKTTGKSFPNSNLLTDLAKGKDFVEYEGKKYQYTTLGWYEVNDYIKDEPKTRRILEVQSDLFQKGRDKGNIEQIIKDLQKSGDLKVDCS